jgi:hypothetical protein
MEILFPCFIIIVVIIIFVALVVVHNGNVDPGAELQNQFVWLGDVIGLSYQEISHIVDRPADEIKEIGDGEKRCRWKKGKYQITLIFKDDKCGGIVSEDTV